MGPFYADADLLDVDVSAELNFLQDFLLEMGDVLGTIVFEDGSSQGFTFGDELFFGGASLIDDNGDDDGLVEFTFFVGPEADLTNNTSVGINVEVNVALLTVEAGYDFEIYSDSVTLRPARRVRRRRASRVDPGLTTPSSTWRSTRASSCSTPDRAPGREGPGPPARGFLGGQA